MRKRTHPGRSLSRVVLSEMRLAMNAKDGMMGDLAALVRGRRHASNSEKDILVRASRA